MAVQSCSYSYTERTLSILLATRIVCVADICYLSNVSVWLYGNRRCMCACIAKCERRRVSEKFSWNFETSSFAKMHLMIQASQWRFWASIVSVCQQITPEQPNLNEFTRNNFWLYRILCISCAIVIRMKSCALNGCSAVKLTKCVSKNRLHIQ